MKKLHQEITLAFSALNSRNFRMIGMVVAVALFILSAGAPNATIGIGK